MQHLGIRPHAFFVPQWFHAYTPSYAGMLEPEVAVPFGDGWQEVTFDTAAGAKFVRVVITSYWGHRRRPE
jgi:hypothetical protein